MGILITILVFIATTVGGADTVNAEAVHATEAVQTVEAYSTVSFDEGSITAYVG